VVRIPADEEVRRQVLGPAAEEAEERGDREGRYGQRQDDAPEDLVLGRAVDGGRLLEILRDRVEVALQVPDRERQLRRDEGDGHADQRRPEVERQVAELDPELV